MLKQGFFKGKSLMGPKLGPADAISMPVCCEENDLYNPKSADENLVKKPYYGLPSYEETDAVYNPMETRTPVNIYHDDYIHETKGSCDVGDLEKQWRQLDSDCKIGQVEAGRISVSDVAINPKMKVEVSESVGSCQYTD
ncbi:hypothetical protein F2Q68_00037833 [Brassica cretica]|uniref:Uncharacterized protein n=1 Tax=Brassica cretica TaxID=69181 RepID=A0A8S9H4M6_BRACR|nr:hypothetical protein F2Q68_00037833 [Brassica cretica]